MRRGPGAGVRLLLLCLLVVGCRDAAVPPWCEGAPGVDIRFDEAPAGWRGVARLHEAWRVDGMTPGMEMILPTAAAVSDDGLLAIVDFDLGDVIVVALDGRLLGRWGRSGEGPGEYRVAVAAAWRERAAGAELLIYDPIGGKLVVFDSDGEPLPDEPVAGSFLSALGGGAHWISLSPGGVLLAQPLPQVPPQETQAEYVVVRGDVHAERVDTVAAAVLPVLTIPGMMPVPAPGWHVPSAAAAPDGRIAIVASARYRIDVQDPGGDVSVRICRDVEAPAVTEAEREPDAELALPQLVTALQESHAPAAPAAIGRVFYDASNRLWVLRDRSRPAHPVDSTLGREGGTFDVYSPEGRYQGELRLPPRTRLLGAVDDLILGLESDDMNVFSVVAWRRAR